MAFVAAPTGLFPQYTYSDSTLHIPLAALDGLTALEADAVSGDWRAIAQAFSYTVQRYYDELATANKPAAFVPAAPVTQVMNYGDFSGKLQVTMSTSWYQELVDLSSGTLPTEA